MKKISLVIAGIVIFNCSLFVDDCKSQWVSYTMPYSGYAYTLGFYDLNKGISFGHTMFPFNQRMFYTTNSGVSWTQTTYPPEIRAIADVQFINASTVYACGSENVNAGLKIMQRNDFAAFPRNIRERYIREGKSEFYSEYKSVFIKSTDGGLNWQKGCLFDTLTGYIMDIQFFDANTGYALIDSNSFGNTKFYKTTNSGTNWNLISRVDTSAEVEKMIFFDMNTGIAKGFNSGGRMYKTTNAGLNWTAKQMPTQIDGLTFYNSTTGIAIGITQTYTTNVYRTTDAGDQWDVVYTIAGRQFQNVKTLPLTGTAFAVGNLLDTNILMYDKITTMKTTDYGLNWTAKEFNPAIIAYGLAMPDANNFYISGGDVSSPAQILKSTNGGNVFVNTIGGEVPTTFLLGQNYPNPFNSLSVIRYQLSVAGQVMLKVYDVLGREVQTLINKKLQAGTYVARFDGSVLNSGVYYYRMVVGPNGTSAEFADTKRLVLLK